MAAIHDHQLHHFSSILSTSVTPSYQYLLYSTLVVSILLPIYRVVRRDYHNFLSLGPGGTPSNFAGYLKVSCLRLFTLKDPLIPEFPATNIRPRDGYLLRLPCRLGPRPAVAGIAPQRQLNQKSSPELHQSFKKAILSLAEAYPSQIRTGTSCFEKNGLALFMSEPSQQAPEIKDSHCHRNPITYTNDALETPGHLNATCGDTAEFCHLHATDSSMHLTLHPSDAALVITHGWGQRHPLAGRQVFGKRLLPPGFVMVYAPQDESQVGVLMEIVRAAGWWVGGIGLGKGQRGAGVLTR